MTFVPVGVAFAENVTDVLGPQPIDVFVDVGMITIDGLIVSTNTL